MKSTLQSQLDAFKHQSFNIGVNTDLIRNQELYGSLRSDHMMLYSLLADRLASSIHQFQQGNNAFVDSEGAFVYFAVDELANLLRTTRRSISTWINSLQEVGLIRRIKTLRGSKFYVYPTVKPGENCEVMSWHHQEINHDHSDFAETFFTFAKILSVKKMVQNVAVKPWEKSSPADEKNLPLSNKQASAKQDNIINKTKQDAHAHDVMSTEKQNSLIPENSKNPNYWLLPEAVRNAYTGNIGYINEYAAKSLLAMTDEFGIDVMIYAISRVKDHKVKHPLRYLEQIIANNRRRNITTVEEMTAFDKKHIETKNPYMDAYEVMERMDKAGILKKYQKPLRERINDFLEEEKSKIKIPIFKLSEQPRVPYQPSLPDLPFN